MLTGTIINSLTILAGSAVGLVLRAVTRRSSKEVSADGLGGRLQTIIMQGMALCVLYIGVSGCLKWHKFESCSSTFKLILDRSV